VIVLKIPYTEIPVPACEAFPEEKVRYVPSLLTTLEYEGMVSQFFFRSIIDSGADNCIFPASYGRILNIPVEGGKKYPYVGAAGSGIAYFHPAPQEAPPVKAGRNGTAVPKGNNLEATAVKPWSGVHRVRVWVEIEKKPCCFDGYCGFADALTDVGLGLLGRHGFFDLFQSVKFLQNERLTELELKV